MDNNIKNRERKNGILDFVLFAMPLAGILAILLSNDRSRTTKFTALAAVVVGLIAAVIYQNSF